MKEQLNPQFMKLINRNNKKDKLSTDISEKENVIQQNIPCFLELSEQDWHQSSESKGNNIITKQSQKQFDYFQMQVTKQTLESDYNRKGKSKKRSELEEIINFNQKNTAAISLRQKQQKVTTQESSQDFFQVFQNQSIQYQMKQENGDSLSRSDNSCKLHNNSKSKQESNLSSNNIEQSKSLLRGQNYSLKLIGKSIISKAIILHTLFTLICELIFGMQISWIFIGVHNISQIVLFIFHGIIFVTLSGNKFKGEDDLRYEQLLTKLTKYFRFHRWLTVASLLSAFVFGIMNFTLIKDTFIIDHFYLKK